MKRVGLLFFIFACLFIVTSKANHYSPVYNQSSSASDHPIDLIGNLSPIKQRSFIQPIQVFESGSSLEVDFSSGLGIIDVYIYDEYDNIVYEEEVNTSVDREITIDISSFGSGEYTIRFVNSQNQYLQGSFEI